MRHTLIFTLKKFTLVSLIFLGVRTSHAQETKDNNNISVDSATEVSDSVRVHELEELIVEGKNVWVEDDKIVFVPTKSEKNLSTDITTLVERMDIPVISVSGSSLISRNNTPVTIFINGRQASAAELQVFWPQNVKRLEYLERPSDPIYQGAACVLNILMKDYEYGGLTSVGVQGNTRIDATFNASSKMVYKSMTYIASVLDMYRNNKISKDEEHEIYKDIFYAGQHFDRVEATSRSDDYQHKFNIVGGRFFAGYVNKANTFIAQHTAEFMHDNTSRDMNAGSLLYTPQIADTHSYISDSPRKSNSLSISGYYGLAAGMAGWKSFLDWTYSHSSGTSASSYEASGTAPIITDTDEKVDKLRFKLTSGKWLSQKTALQFALSNTNMWYDTDYSGNTNARSKQFSSTAYFTTQFVWTPLSFLQFQAYAVLGMEAIKLNDDATRYNFMPTVGISGSASLGSTQSFSFGLDYNRSSVNASKLTEVLVRRNLLMSVIGNPDLNPESYIKPQINYNWFPSNRFNLGASVSLIHNFNEILQIYTPGGESIDGIIEQYAGNIGAGDLSFGVNASWTMIKNLRLRGSCSFLHSYNNESKHLNSIYYNLSASYTFRNCAWELKFNSPRKRALDAVNSIMRNKNYGLDFNFTWGTGNLYLSASINNILNRYTNLEYTYGSRFYDFRKLYREVGRNASLTLTYTFDYGKKIDASMMQYSGLGGLGTSVLN